MAAGGANQKAHIISPNRAPFYSDAVVDGNLLAASGTKTITASYANGTPANGVAHGVAIWNDSGQDATVVISACMDDIGKEHEEMTNAMYIKAGTSVPNINQRIVSIKETNIGAGSQTGRGVRYLFTMEPTR